MAKINEQALVEQAQIMSWKKDLYKARIDLREVDYQRSCPALYADPLGSQSGTESLVSCDLLVKGMEAGHWSGTYKEFGRLCDFLMQKMVYADAVTEG